MADKTKDQIIAENADLVAANEGLIGQLEALQATIDSDQGDEDKAILIARIKELEGELAEFAKRPKTLVDIRKIKAEKDAARIKNRDKQAKESANEVEIVKGERRRTCAAVDFDTFKKQGWSKVED